MSKTEIKNIFEAVLICFFGIFLFTFFTLLRNTIQTRRPIYSTPTDYGISFEEVEFKTKDGLRLKGWLLLNNRNIPTIIICHGFGTSRSDVLVLADFIYKAGYNVLLFDFRAHGESQGWYTSFGYLETQDLDTAVEFLKNNSELNNKNFGVIGVSMGGSVAIMAAAKNENIKAVVADSPYADLDSAIIQHAKLLLKTPNSFLGHLAIFAYRLRFFTDSSNISPLKDISTISPRAVMIISGTKDVRMPPQDAEKLYLNARQPKELFLVVSEGHTNSFWQDREEYQRRVLDFLYKHLWSLSISIKE